MKFKGILSKNPDRFVSIAAIVVSFGTLFMIFYQTNLIREEQKASVMPSLLIGYSINNGAEQIHVDNQGLGPAFIKKISVYYDGKNIEGDPYNFFQEVYPEIADPTKILSLDRLFEGRIIPKNERVIMFKRKIDSSPIYPIRDKFAYSFKILGETKSKDKAVVKITYESVYGERWTISSNQSVPVEN